MPPLLITAGAWVGLIASVYWLVRTVLKPQADKHPRFVIGRILIPVTTILIAVGLLVRDDIALSLPLAFVAFALGLLGTALQVRLPTK
jgi:hypothetical protein